MVKERVPRSGDRPRGRKGRLKGQAGEKRSCFLIHPGIPPLRGIIPVLHAPTETVARRELGLAGAASHQGLHTAWIPSSGQLRLLGSSPSRSASLGSHTHPALTFPAVLQGPAQRARQAGPNPSHCLLFAPRPPGSSADRGSSVWTKPLTLSGPRGGRGHSWMMRLPLEYSLSLPGGQSRGGIRVRL